MFEDYNYLTLFNKAAECSLNAIGMADLEGILIYVNDSALKLWGYDDKDEMIGRYLAEFWGGGNGSRKPLRNCTVRGIQKVKMLENAKTVPYLM